MIWAALGATALVFQVVVFTRWIAAGDVRAGPRDYDISPGVRAFGILTQILLVTVIIVAGTICWRQCRAHRAVTLDAAVMVGFALAFWIEPLGVHGDVLVAVNRSLLNVQTWGPYLPLWEPPPGDTASIHALFGPNMFIYGGSVMWLWIQRGLMLPVHRLLPGRSTPRLLPWFFVTAILADFFINITLVPLLRSFIYPRALWDWSLFGGHWYQIPVTQHVIGLTMGFFLVVMEHHALTRNRTIQLFRGTEHLPRRAQHLTRLLAGVGFCNLAILSYFLLVQLVAVTMGTDPTPPDTPSYLWPGS